MPADSPPAMTSGKGAPRVSPEDYRANLSEIDRAAREIGAKALFCRPAAIPLSPTCVGPAYYDPPPGVAVLDMSAPFAGLCLPEASRYFKDHSHPTAEGARVMAEAIAAAIRMTNRN